MATPNIFGYSTAQLNSNIFGYNIANNAFVTTHGTQSITGTKIFESEGNVYYGDGSHLTGITQPTPTNMVTIDTTQTITGAKTMNNAANVFYGSGANLTGIPPVATTVTTDTTQTITGAKTMNNAANVFYGSGANLTGIPAPSNMMTTDTDQAISGIKTFGVPVIISDYGSSTTNSNLVQQKTALNATNNSQTLTISTFTARTLSANQQILTMLSATPQNFVYQLGDFISCTTFTNDGNILLQISSIKEFRTNITTVIGSPNIVSSTTLLLGTNFNWTLDNTFTTGAYVASGTFPNYVMSSNATVAGTLVSRPFFIAYVNQNITSAIGSTTIDFTRTASINLSCSSTAATAITNNTISVGNDNCLVNGTLFLTRPTYSCPNRNTYQSTLYGIYPIGYSTTYTQTATTFTSGAVVVLTTGVTLTGGVWAMDTIQRIVRGTGTFSAASASSVILTLISGTGTILPTLAVGVNQPIPNGATNPTIDLMMGNYTLTVTSANAIVQHSQSTVMTVGTATRQMIITFTKIA